jgi:hypothetical protein
MMWERQRCCCWCCLCCWCCSFLFVVASPPSHRISCFASFDPLPHALPLCWYANLQCRGRAATNAICHEWCALSWCALSSRNEMAEPSGRTAAVCGRQGGQAVLLPANVRAASSRQHAVPQTHLRPRLDHQRRRYHSARCVPLQPTTSLLTSSTAW